MVNRTKLRLRLHTLVAIVLLLPFDIFSRQYDDSNSFAKGCFGVAAGAALIGAVACVANYFFRPSDQQQFDAAVLFYNNLCDSRGPLIDSFRNYFGIQTPFYIADEERVLRVPDEYFLNEMGWKLWTSRKPFVEFMRTIRYELKQLQDYHNDLTSRLNTLRNARPLQIDLITNIEKFLHDIQYNLRLLELFVTYCDKYTSYFQLSECGWRIFYKYEEELRLIDAYRYDMPTLIRCLHDIVIRESRQGFPIDEEYPYIAYFDHLVPDIIALTTVKNNNLYLYPDRIHWVSGVLANLEWLRGALDPYYQYELIYRQQKELQKRIQQLEMQRYGIESSEYVRMHDQLIALANSARDVQGKFVVHIY